MNRFVYINISLLAVV